MTEPLTQEREQKLLAEQRSLRKELCSICGIRDTTYNNIDYAIRDSGCGCEWPEICARHKRLHQIRQELHRERRISRNADQVAQPDSSPVWPGYDEWQTDTGSTPIGGMSYSDIEYASRYGRGR